MIESIFREPALIGYLVKKLKEEHPDKQVGKTVIQKMVYLLVSKKVTDFDYSMYHYGPYSSGVSGELNFVENNGLVEIEWIEDKGYSITSGSIFENFESFVTEDKKHQIDEVVKEYGTFNAKDLSLIATALFLKDNFGVLEEDLPAAVHGMKKQYPVEYIKRILEKAKIINDQIPF